MQEKRFYNLESLIEFRRDLHRHPELCFKETRTSTKIIEYLTSLGVKENQIKRFATTGITVDIKGQGKPSNKPFCVALRADMDALPIKENNPEIQHQSTIDGVAHACGHDLHTTCLIGGAAKILEKIDQIPSDKCVRLLFQPAEESLSGAIAMIKEGALEGVNEVYGFHNLPVGRPGELMVQPGFMLASATKMIFNINGQGGHSRDTEELHDPLQPAVDIHIAFRALVKEYKEKGINFTFSVPFISSGISCATISNTCRLEGAFSSFDENFTEELKNRIKEIATNCCEKLGCTVDIELLTLSPPVWNTEKETENVIRVAKRVLGNDKIRTDGLPIHASDDFAYFSRTVPGAFFFLTSSRSGPESLHTDHFEPDEGVIPIACEMWYKLVEDRLELNFDNMIDYS